MTCNACTINNVGDKAMATKATIMISGFNTSPAVTPKRCTYRPMPKSAIAAARMLTMRAMSAIATMRFSKSLNALVTRSVWKKYATVLTQVINSMKPDCSSEKRERKISRKPSKAWPSSCRSSREFWTSSPCARKRCFSRISR